MLRGVLSVLVLAACWPSGAAAMPGAGAGLSTTIPVAVGAEAFFGAIGRGELVIGGGYTPDAYVTIIERFAQDQEGSDVIESTLGTGKILSVGMRVFPVPGWYLYGGYEAYWVDGTIGVKVSPSTVMSGLEEPDTGSDLPIPGGGGGVPGPGLPSDEPSVTVQEDVSSVIHVLRVGLGYRMVMEGRWYLQGEVSVIKAVDANSKPEHLDSYLHDVYVDNLLVPVVGISAGFTI